MAFLIANDLILVQVKVLQTLHVRLFDMGQLILRNIQVLQEREVEQIGYCFKLILVQVQLLEVYVNCCVEGGCL